MCGFFLFVNYRGADKSLGRPGGNKLMFLSEWREFPLAPCLAEKNLDDSSRLDIVDIACVLDMLPSFFLTSRAKDLSAPR